MSSANNHEAEHGQRRADARRNRAALLDAAHRLFAAHGVEAGIPAIAAAAGVAVGTIYRHYPSKEQLIEAVVVERLQAIIALAERASAEDTPAPFGTFFRAVALLCVEDGRFAGTVSDLARTSPQGQQADQQLQAALGRLLDRAFELGELRLRLEPIDIPILLAGVRRAVQEEDSTRWERYVGIVLDGVQAQHDGSTRVAREPA